MGLNQQQQKAVQSVGKPVLVLAGAGSGKTSVITQKIAWLIQKSGYAPHNIAAVTFTNKAAKEMKERVAGLLKGTNTRGLIVSTFHTLGLQILRRERDNTYLNNGFSIMDSEDSMRLLKAMMSQEESDTQNEEVKHVQWLISDWKNKGMLPEQIINTSDDKDTQRLGLIYQRYSESLKAYNSVDFDDLILIPLQLFLQDEKILNRWQRRIRYLLVDEFQDTNHTQYQLVRLLTAQHQGMTAVGDDDQSIYAWRGAQPDNLLQLQKDYSALELIKLEQNYRSTNRILEAANHLISNNPRYIPKKLWSQLGQGDMIRVVKRDNEIDEVQWLAQDLHYRVMTKQRSYGDFAILYRSNHQSRQMEVQLQAMGIPYRVSGGTPFYARTEVKDILAYLRLLLNPDDDSALLRIINTPKRQIGNQTILALSEHARQKQLSIFSAIDTDLTAVLKSAQIDKLTNFKRMMEETLKQCEQDDPIKAINELLEGINYFQWLHDISSAVRVAEKRFSHVRILIDSLEQMMQRQAEREDEDVSRAEGLSAMEHFEAAMKRMMLQDILDNQEDEANQNQVQLLTLHACKGLEFKEVYLIGVEERILPHYNSVDDNQIEEERRLFYVGITRARENLCLTLARQRKQYGETKATVVSRFIDELPDDIEYMGFADKQVVVTQEQEDDAFNDILSMLKG